MKNIYLKILTNKFFTFFVLIAVIIAGFFALFHYRNTVFSKNVLQIEILGPDTAEMGEEITYTIKYKNSGNFVLEDPKLIFELPDNSLTEDGNTRFVKKLENLSPGKEGMTTFKNRLLGKEGDVKITKASFSYVPRNLSVRYESEVTFATKINSVNMELTYGLPPKIEKGEELTYSINYVSNIDYPLENLSIKLDYLSGFDFKSSDPVSLDSGEYKLKTLLLGQGGKINITGVVNADAPDSLHFAARLGMWIDGTFVVIKDVGQDMQTTAPLFIEPPALLPEQLNTQLITP